MQSARPLDRKQRSANRNNAPQIRAAIEALKQKFGKDVEAGTERTLRGRGRS
jgi:hypothetical protein